jgi:hypothetical protein
LDDIASGVRSFADQQGHLAMIGGFVFLAGVMLFTYAWDMFVRDGEDE